MLSHSIKLVIQTLFFVAIFVNHSGFAVEQEDGIDLFLKAIVNQSRSSIHSGKGSYILTRNEYKTEEEIQKECDKMIADLRQNFPNDPDLENVIKDVPRSVKSSYSRTMNGTFRFDYSQKDYQYFEDKITIDDPLGYSNTTSTIQRKDFHKKSPQTENVNLVSSFSEAYVKNIESSVESFYQFGRLRGILSGLMMNQIAKKGDMIAKDEIKRQIQEAYGNKKEMKILEIIETKPFDDGSTSYILESAIEGKVTQRYTIVPSLGYICPKIEFFDIESGNPTEAYEASGFVKHTQSGLYYPTYYSELDYDSASGRLLEKTEFKIDQETLSLNEKMSPKDFVLDISSGVQVHDMRNGININYIATEKGALTLESNGLDLEKMSWLRRTDSLPINPLEHKSLLLRVVFLVVGVILVAWGLSRRRRNKKSSAT